MNKKWLIVLIVLIIVLILMVIWSQWNQAKSGTGKNIEGLPREMMGDSALILPLIQIQENIFQYSLIK